MQTTTLLFLTTNASLSSLLQEYAKHHTCRIVPIEHISQISTHLKSHTPVLTLIDTTGYEFSMTDTHTDTIRNLLCLKKIPMLFIVDEIAPHYENQRQLECVAEYIKTPVDKTDLFLRLKTLCYVATLSQSATEKDQCEIKNYSLINEHVILLHLDKNHTIQFVSKAFCNISGFSRSELIGKKLYTLMDESLDHELLKDICNSTSQGLCWFGQIKFQHKTHTSLKFRATIEPRYDDKERHIGYSGFFVDITDRTTLIEQSMHDTLTGLFNEQHFFNVFDLVIDHCRRYNQHISLIKIDLDFFNLFNATQGHDRGDDAMKKIAHTLVNSMHRINDYVFRLHGDSFAVLFSGVDEYHSKKVAEKLRKAVEALAIVHPKNSASKFISVSLGLVVKQLDSSKIDKQELISEADQALYYAKVSGHNTVSVFQSP